MQSGATSWLFLITIVGAFFAFDLWRAFATRTPPSARNAILWSVGWFAVGLLFAFYVWGAHGARDGADYVAGFLVEKSLSLDNVFVFFVILGSLAIPQHQRGPVLAFGIIIALVLRAIAIVIGAAALERFHWLAWAFAALLIWTGWRLWKSRDSHDDGEEIVARVQRYLPLSGVALAFVTVAIADILFAVDSVPAILAITTDTYVVWAANAFALLGMRPLFFLVSDLVERFHHLKAGLAILLVFIGVKMALAEVVGKIGPEISLPIMIAILAGSIIWSIKDPQHAPHAHAPEGDEDAEPQERAPQLTRT
jgi:tellurite resistance protein TerC